MISAELQYQPAYALRRCRWMQGTRFAPKPASMVSMDGRSTIETQATGGFMKSLRRSVLGGESFFTNTFRATGNRAEMTLAPSLPGDIAVWDLAATTCWCSREASSRARQHRGRHQMGRGEVIFRRAKDCSCSAAPVRDADRHELRCDPSSVHPGRRDLCGRHRSHRRLRSHMPTRFARRVMEVDNLRRRRVGC